MIWKSKAFIFQSMSYFCIKISINLWESFKNQFQKKNTIFDWINNCSGLKWSFTLSNSLKSLGNGSFLGCSGDYAFYRCNGFKSLNLPKTCLLSISKRTFSRCSWVVGSLIVPSSVTIIGDRAFYVCWSLDGDLIIPDSVMSIGDGAFRYCYNIKSLKISEKVNSKSSNLFLDCSSLKGTIKIPYQVNIIGDKSFYNCSSISGLIMNNKYTNIALACMTIKLS